MYDSNYYDYNYDSNYYDCNYDSNYYDLIMIVINCNHPVVQNDERLDPSSTYLVPTIGKQAGIRKEDYDTTSCKVFKTDKLPNLLDGLKNLLRLFKL